LQAVDDLLIIFRWIGRGKILEIKKLFDNEKDNLFYWILLYDLQPVCTKIF